MRELLKKLRRVKFVICRSHPMIKVAALCTVVLSMLALLGLQGAITGSRANAAALMEQADRLEQENQNLVQYIDELGTVQGIERIAEDELGLVAPDPVIIEPQQ